MYKRIFLVCLSVLLVTGLLAGCAAESDKGNVLVPGVKADSIGTNVVEANSGFAFRIFKEMYTADTEGNLFISPASISTALAMVMNGAKGNTLNEMMDTLGFKGIDQAEVNSGFAYLVSLLNRNEGGVELSLANSIWIRKGFNVLDTFKAVNSDYFAASIEELDFNDPGAPVTINDWVRETTNGKIDGIVGDTIHPATVMFLINSIYFKGEWKTPFDPDRTYSSDFFVDGTATGTVDMMNYKNDTMYYEGNGYKIISLPYGEEDMVMDLILPDEGIKTADFIRSFGLKDYKAALAGLTEESEVIVSIPAFKAEYETKLNDVLHELGIRDLFSSVCDLSGINGSGDLFVSEVKHKTYIDVNEEGTEAAGVTSVEIRLTAVMDPTEFIADRPFLYTIRDTRTESILFMGVFDTPEQ